MNLAFLQAELPSPRFGAAYAQKVQMLRCDQRIITQTDLTNARENLLRKRLLMNVRGYTNKTSLFAGFPADVPWRHVILTPEEAGSLW
jgi:hypothetical protein